MAPSTGTSTPTSFSTCNSKDCCGENNGTNILDLPSELREYIWELAFISTVPLRDRSINLAFARGPNKALLLTCSQIYGEAVELYNKVHDRYWSTTSFYLEVDRYDEYDVQATREEIARHSNFSLSQISRLFIGDNPYTERANGYEFRDGLWTCTRSSCGSYPIPSCPHLTLMLMKKDYDNINTVPATIRQGIAWSPPIEFHLGPRLFGVVLHSNLSEKEMQTAKDAFG